MAKRVTPTTWTTEQRQRYAALRAAYLAQHADKCQPRQDWDGSWSYVTLGGTLSIGHRSERGALTAANRHKTTSAHWHALHGVKGAKP
jgi:hypothetical protein